MRTNPWHNEAIERAQQASAVAPGPDSGQISNLDRTVIQRRTCRQSPLHPHRTHLLQLHHPGHLETDDSEFARGSIDDEYVPLVGRPRKQLRRASSGRAKQSSVKLTSITPRKAKPGSRNKSEALHLREKVSLTILFATLLLSSVLRSFFSGLRFCWTWFAI